MERLYYKGFDDPVLDGRGQMSSAAIGFLNLYLHIPGCASLKEKRRRLKPLIARLQREFNISVAEIDHQDIWQNALIGCVMISNDAVFTRKNLSNIVKWIDHNWPDIDLVDEEIEIFSA
jgi:uncharacterized protein YlxP (DUF503 family)